VDMISRFPEAGLSGIEEYFHIPIWIIKINIIVPLALGETLVAKNILFLRICCLSL